MVTITSFCTFTYYVFLWPLAIIPPTNLKKVFHHTLKMPSSGDQSFTMFEMPSNWLYRGEGNCNIVLSLPQLGKILRIRKIDSPRSFIGWLLKWISDLLYWYTGGDIMEELRDLKFYSTIMRPLVGIKYTSEASQVVLNWKQVRILEEELVRYRPERRKHKILQCGRASLFNDFAFIPEDEYDYLPFDVADDTFAIELKPKQGWRPLSEKHYPACVYCMNQYYKLQQKKIKVLSNYCPEDLFSGNESRMMRAIYSLIQVPQNNFRIFKNGTLIYGEHTATDFSNIVRSFFGNRDDMSQKLVEEFSNLVRKCLITNFMNVNLTEGCEERLFCEWNKIIQGSNAHILPKNCVLEKILSIQMLDIEGSVYYDKLLNNREVLEDWKYIDLLLNKINNSNECFCLKCTIMMLGNVNRREEEVDLTFIPYLISAVAKDCSLMITVKRVDENISDDLEIRNIIRTNYGHFLVNIGVFDLYPKPLSSIRKHCQRNKEIFKAYVAGTTKKI
ncbi:inositol-pentakisphosphate 2-kinase isoform X1 [Diorhabda sublineata]|uniref:inositol-pentakisphosphate 2-kinase isoform X1 n=1 Tax=Diorhabda sublineata TaxID=1163346 RepID=UPI0024E0D4FE|nr:inositol-pentakisphosphate 2-kinase isoform X1 [Diorhabda sublineata]